MPNWIRNNITITGAKDTLQTIYDRCQKAGGFSFTLFLPMPDTLDIPSGSLTMPAAVYAWSHTHPEGVRPPAELQRTISSGRAWEDAVTKAQSIANTLNDGDDEVTAGTFINTKAGFLKLGKTVLSNFQNYGCFDGYSWRCQNWGTKWDASDPYLEVPAVDPKTGVASMELTFNTAWSFPAPIMEEISRQYPDIAISGKYADEDIGSNCGSFTAAEGMMQVDYSDGDIDFACSVWGYDPDEFRAEMEENYE